MKINTALILCAGFGKRWFLWPFKSVLCLNPESGKHLSYISPGVCWHKGVEKCKKAETQREENSKARNAKGKGQTFCAKEFESHSKRTSSMGLHIRVSQPVLPTQIRGKAQIGRETETETQTKVSQM